MLARTLTRRLLNFNRLANFGVGAHGPDFTRTLSAATASAKTGPHPGGIPNNA